MEEAKHSFDTVDIHSNSVEDEDEDLFVSAVQNPVASKEETPTASLSASSSTVQHGSLYQSTLSEPIRFYVGPSTGLEEVETDHSDQFIKITITDPHKVGEGMGSYMAYKVNTQTNVPLFRQTQFSVLRRFSDFLGLHEKLVEKYLRMGRIIPPAPEKSMVGNTRARMGGESSSGDSNSDFIERRRAALERFLNRIASHPKLSVDPDFREFLEAEKELPRATNTSALSGAGVLRLFNKVGETVNKMTFRMEENDPWFEDKAQLVEALDTQLRKIHNSVEALILNRRDLATATGQFAKSAAILSNAEEHTSLARALSQLADLEEKLESLHMQQAHFDLMLFAEHLKDYIGLFGAIKDVLHERVKVYQNWQHAQLMLTKKREVKSKWELQEKRDRIPGATAELVDWTAKVERGKEEFDAISAMIRKELERFDLNRVKDFKAMFIRYLESMVDQQQQVVKYWEAFLPEAKAIA